MKLINVLAVLALSALLAAIFWPVYSTNGRSSPVAFCMSQLKQQAIGFEMYRADADERYPNRDHWMDALFPYVKNEDLYHEPVRQTKAPQPSTYGYAFNSNLSNAKAPKSAETTPMVYDSVNPIRNASDPAVSLPSPGRHNGRDIIAYADCHAKAVKVGELVVH